MGNFNMLPKEIMLEIFSRVPAESVLECKSVSKSWRNLLQHPSFPQMHLNHLNDFDAAHDSGNLSLIFYTKWLDKEPFYYTEYDENLNRFTRTTRINVRPPFEYYDILHSCNGLVCFSAYLGNCHNMQPAYICNPITREYTVIPKFEGKEFLAGFGYSPSTNEYKVVRISRDMGDPNFGIVQRNESNLQVIWSNEFSNCYGRPISFTKSGGLLCYDLRDNNVYRYAPKASSSRVLVNFDKKFTVGVPHKNTVVSLKSLEEENTELLNSGERARYSWGPNEQEAATISQRNRRKKKIS
ncbi:F-box protein At3g07870-like [Papaver somniferum]|uniref:F-box protein At3g07870-like n=1 Tax=Papaver somniferum TaxID=3469 RepID=UPI000E7001E7|nr:F-box protein At3g07870-like [Papaver somniferum]